ncbi:hypothetical protein BDZ89DRAFT_1134736 [Hymenopellis radicata]|nr:hypothetical protein BDZ89DRAFT_1134736 [Hymenopellis radicata]
MSPTSNLSRSSAAISVVSAHFQSSTMVSTRMLPKSSFLNSRNGASIDDSGSDFGSVQRSLCSRGIDGSVEGRATNDASSLLANTYRPGYRLLELFKPRLGTNYGQVDFEQRGSARRRGLGVSEKGNSRGYGPPPLLTTTMEAAAAPPPRYAYLHADGTGLKLLELERPSPAIRAAFSAVLPSNSESIQPLRGLHDVRLTLDSFARASNPIPQCDAVLFSFWTPAGRSASLRILFPWLFSYWLDFLLAWTYRRQLTHSRINCAVDGDLDLFAFGFLAAFGTLTGTSFRYIGSSDQRLFAAAPALRASHCCGYNTVDEKLRHTRNNSCYDFAVHDWLGDSEDDDHTGASGR